MKNLVLFIVSFCLFSCSKAVQDNASHLKKSEPIKKAVDMNTTVSRLPVAITYTIPQSWLSTEPSNSMVLEERIIDPVSQAKFKAFYFEGMQGKTEANLDRWQDQFKAGDKKLISKQKYLISQIPVVEFYMTGTYLEKENMRDPDSQVFEKANFAMKAFIVETQTGTWFFKSVAPIDVIERQAQNFEYFLISIKENL